MANNNNIKLTALRDIINKAKDCKKFLKENILTDIIRQNKAVFENEGNNLYGDGSRWIPNSPRWTAFKEKNVGQIARAYGQNFMVKNANVMRLTDRMYKALTRNSPSQDVEHVITNNKLSYISKVEYQPFLESGYGKVPPREVLFAGKNQVKQWANMLQKYLMP